MNPCEHPVSTKRLHILKHNLLSLYYVLVYIRFFRFQCLWLALFPFLKVLIKSLFSKKKTKKKNGFCNLFRTVHTVLIRSILSNKKVFVPTQIFRDKIIRLQYPLVFKGNQHQFKSVVPFLLSAATSCEVSRGWFIFFQQKTLYFVTWPCDSISKSLFMINIFDALRDTVSFVQFRKREIPPWEIVTFSKVAGWSLQVY